MTKFGSTLPQRWPLPSAPRPIVIIGAGGIVVDAHLPAYKLAGFTVAGIFDIDDDRARQVGTGWDIPVFSSLAEAVNVGGAVFDLALPPAAHLAVLNHLPDGSAVLLQKPMGSDLDEATKILAVCHQKKLRAAVNFQLRFSPMMLAAKAALSQGLLGDLVDVEVHLNLQTPWELFPFLKGMSRVEISVHSIHYFDVLRHFLGEATGVHARTMGHPSTDLAQTRTSALVDFGANVRCCLSINHNHDFGRKFQDASFRFEGTKGAAIIKLGLLLNYPDGEPDALWIANGKDDWREIELEGGWFPDAFVGTMSNLQRFVADEDQTLISSVDDAWHTMALVEAAFTSANNPATPIKASP